MDIPHLNLTTRRFTTHCNSRSRNNNATWLQVERPSFGLHSSIQHRIGGIRQQSSLDIRTIEIGSQQAGWYGGRWEDIAIRARLTRRSSFNLRMCPSDRHRRVFTASTTSNDADYASSRAERPLVTLDIQALIPVNVL